MENPLERKIIIIPRRNGIVAKGLPYSITAKLKKYMLFLRAKGLSHHSARAKAYDILVFFRFLNKQKLPLESPPSSDAVIEFVASEKSRKCKNSSINRRLGTIKQFYQVVFNCSVMPLGTEHPFYPKRDPYLGLWKFRGKRSSFRLKERQEVVEPLAIQEVNAMIRGATKYRDLAIILLMLTCGLRAKEVLELRDSDIDPQQLRLRVFGKGSKERVVPASPETFSAIDRYVKVERPRPACSLHLFLSLQGKNRGKRLTYEGLRKIFRTNRKKSAVLQGNPHRFRHTFGANMAQSGVKPFVLKELMGHSSFSTTMRYIRLSMQDINEDYQRAIAEIQKRYSKT